MDFSVVFNSVIWHLRCSSTCLDLLSNILHTRLIRYLKSLQCAIWVFHWIHLKAEHTLCNFSSIRLLQMYIHWHQFLSLTKTPIIFSIHISGVARKISIIHREHSQSYLPLYLRDTWSHYMYTRPRIFDNFFKVTLHPEIPLKEYIIQMSSWCSRALKFERVLNAHTLILIHCLDDHVYIFSNPSFI